MKKIDLLDDNIYKNLFRLSLPIMITSFIQMSYTLMDTFWVGKLGTEAIAAVGIVAFIMWFANSLVLVSKTGIEIGVAYSIGAKDDRQFRKYIDTSFVINLAMSTTFGLLLFIFRTEIIAFFNMKSSIVLANADKYLKIVLLGMPFTFLNPVFSGIFNGSANSKVPFIANSCGLFINIILDPLLIYGFFGFPELGISGAAFATTFSQMVVTFIFLIFAIKDSKILKGFNMLKNFDYSVFKEVLKLGIPTAFKSCIFAFISTVLLRIIANWGESAVAAENVAVQIEAINWMTVEGFSIALCALVGQNYGAKNYKNITYGYKKGLKIILSIGIFCSFFLYFSSDYIMKLFIKTDLNTINMGISYLKILAFSEIFLALEIGISGMFNGLKNTKTPTIISTLCNALRIPLAYLVYYNGLSIEYIWFVISFCTFLKGMSNFIAFKYFIKKNFDFSL
ncbi:MAG: MATE family efflux transporter [Peptoniphilaceae bacterium]|uniref:MATE family efflux transporter n=1 Tax=Parvimonas sp. TaxID=1944660 RepID=UPI002A7518EC|nr:MATE family efflux transporter [Parvimonas sp.]MDD7765041.1 MATE family efflux transporter [Peptoniphilaceae bacterium]MDY3050275.1 MATE family efflux transporter [Parvimonas sp.]